MNNSLMLKWMWQWISDKQDWWKEATPTPGPHIRPWEMTNTSPFWKSIALLEPIFHASVQFQIGQGASLQFWHDVWLQDPLKFQFPQLYDQTIR
jgi:hypothetical protein